MSFSPYGSYLKELLGSSATITVVGYSGWTTTQMVLSLNAGQVTDAVGKKWPGLKTVLDREAFDLAIVMAGTNDLGRGHPADVGSRNYMALRWFTLFVFNSQVIFENLVGIYAAIRECSVSKVLALGIPDSAFQAYHEGAQQCKEEVNQRLAEFAANSNGVIDYFPCPVPFIPNSIHFEPDGLHFSEAGYKHLATFLHGKILTMMDSLKAN